MMRSIGLVIGLTLWLLGAAASAATPGYALTTSADDPLVKQLEGRLDALQRAAAKGDLSAVRALRSAAGNKRLPITDAAALKRFAPLIAPDRAGYRFVQMESSAQRARLVWYKSAEDRLNVLVQMFVKEGDWKVDGNHNENFVGAVPKVSVAVEQALKSPWARLPAP